MNRYEEKQERRREGLQGAAERARERADRSFEGARSEVAGIPFGQPILVGHHSERRHRRALEKHDTKMRRGFEESTRAQDLARRAEAVGSGGISSDDPDAVTKLRAELAEHEARRESIKRVNQAWRRVGKPRPAAPDGAAPDVVELNRAAWEKFAELANLPAAEVQKVRLSMARDFMAREPYPAYVLQNLGGNIRRIEGRIADLAGQATRAVPEPRTAGPMTLSFDPDDNRVVFTFDSKPPADVRELLKRNGWLWSPSRGANVRKWTPNAAAMADYLFPRLAEKLGVTLG